MAGWAAGTEPANVRTGNQGDTANAQPLKLMRGVDMSPRYFIYIFNVSRYGQVVPKGARSYTLKGVTDDSQTVESERGLIPFEIGAKIPSTVVDTYINMESKRVPETQEGEEVARDILCPSAGPTCDNNDLRRWGCGYFKRLPHEAPVPTVAELMPVVEAYDENMRLWLKDADQLATGGQLIQINPVHRRAAAHFKAKRDWNQVVTHPDICPNCSAEIQPGIKFHTLLGTNILCIIGQDGWQVAVKAGIKKRHEVPDEFVWWAETPAQKKERQARQAE